MNHLHLAASSSPASSREIGRDATSTARARLHLVPDTGSLLRSAPAMAAAPKGPGLLAAVLRVAILASASIALVTRADMSAPDRAFEPAGFAAPASLKEAAEAFITATYGSPAAPASREVPR